MTHPDGRPAARPTVAGRSAVLVAAILSLLAKLMLAASTGGTQDGRAWAIFAAGVRERGPVGVYGIDFLARDVTMYNHPPLVGYVLEALVALDRWGLPVEFSLRATAAVSDVLAALVVFEVLRRRRRLGEATVAGVATAASPVLLLVSGYHVNTDPVMMMLLWLGGCLLVDRRLGASGGMALALAISMKLAAVVALPALAVWLLRSGDGRLLRRAAGGFAATTAIVWGPALLTEWDGVRSNVLGYAGVSDRPWGLVKLLDLVDLSMASAWLVGPGRFAILLVCAGVPAVLAWARPMTALECVALSVISFLVLSPAFGVQYLAWASAAAVLLAIRAGLAYNVLGGLFLLAVYADWNHGLDWTGVAKGQPFRPIEVIAGLALWATLVVVVSLGVRRILRSVAGTGQSATPVGRTGSGGGLERAEQQTSGAWASEMSTSTAVVGSSSGGATANGRSPLHRSLEEFSPSPD